MSRTRFCGSQASSPSPAPCFGAHRPNSSGPPVACQLTSFLISLFNHLRVCCGVESQPPRSEGSSIAHSAAADGEGGTVRPPYRWGGLDRMGSWIPPPPPPPPPACPHKRIANSPPPTAPPSPWMPRSVDAQVPYIKWQSICSLLSYLWIT